MPANDRSHYTYGYRKRALAVRQRAYADPLTRCWRCGLTLNDEQARWPHKVVSWHAGHTVDGDNSAPLLPEHSTCNQRAGAMLGWQASRKDGSGRWW